jgi:hypothetical protein
MQTSYHATPSHPFSESKAIGLLGLMKSDHTSPREPDDPRFYQRYLRVVVTVVVGRGRIADDCRTVVVVVIGVR